MAIDLDDPIAVMLAAAAVFEEAGSRRPHGGLMLGMYGGGGQLNSVDLVRPRSARYAAAMMAQMLVEAEIARLADELTDHDIRGRFGNAMK